MEFDTFLSLNVWTSTKYNGITIDKQKIFKTRNM